MSTPFSDPAVEAAYALHPEPLRSALLRLRHLILITAVEHPQTGGLVEALRWGEPAYLPERPRVGTTIRLNAVRRSTGRYAAYFNCKTTLIPSFRLLYPDAFAYGGNRAILFSLDRHVAEGPFQHCVALALTYHLSKPHP
jgi:hypothetical protein